LRDKHIVMMICFFFQAEDGIRDRNVTGVQTCALPISIEKYSFFDKIENMMQHDIQWDLEKDLKMLAKKYQEIVASKKEMILISMREEGRFPVLDDAISRLPLSYRDTISNYFTEMMKKEKMKTIDADVAATNFLFINFGYFFLKDRL